MPWVPHYDVDVLGAQDTVNGRTASVSCGGHNNGGFATALLEEEIRQSSNGWEGNVFECTSGAVPHLSHFDHTHCPERNDVIRIIKI